MLILEKLLVGVLLINKYSFIGRLFKRLEVLPQILPGCSFWWNDHLI